MAHNRIIKLYTISDAVERGRRIWGADWSFKKYERYWKRVNPIDPDISSATEAAKPRANLQVAGGYMERLTLACLKHGLID